MRVTGSKIKKYSAMKTRTPYANEGRNTKFHYNLI